VARLVLLESASQASRYRGSASFSASRQPRRRPSVQDRRLADSLENDACRRPGCAI